MKYLMRDYIYGWHWENFKASYEHGNSAIFKFLAVQQIARDIKYPEAITN